MKLDYIRRDFLNQDQLYKWLPLVEKRDEEDLHDGFQCSVDVKHSDGSKFILNNAFLLEDETEIMVFTEHCGYFHFYKDDLSSFLETGPNGENLSRKTMGFKTSEDFKSRPYKEGQPAKGISWIGNSRIDNIPMYSVDNRAFIEAYDLEPMRYYKLTLSIVSDILSIKHLKLIETLGYG